MSRKIRSAVVAFALVNLVVSAAFALPRAGQPTPARAAGISTAWEWLAGLFAPTGRPQGRGGNLKAGSSSDPFGGPGFGNPTSFSASDAGSQMDPNGYK
ncbi:MAG TPA: hypothetical protein VIE43_15605 [Thermoanaerobaculia bacterium]|jgi:hypothetical protein|nr:hypothetical protein [Thermoanaerobaculia bacterium]